MRGVLETPMNNGEPILGNTIIWMKFLSLWWHVSGHGNCQVKHCRTVTWGGHHESHLQHVKPLVDILGFSKVDMIILWEF